MDTPVAYAEKLRPRHHAKKNPLLGTLAINQKINPKGLTLIRRAGKWGGGEISLLPSRIRNNQMPCFTENGVSYPHRKSLDARGDQYR